MRKKVLLVVALIMHFIVIAEDEMQKLSARRLYCRTRGNNSFMNAISYGKWPWYSERKTSGCDYIWLADVLIEYERHCQRKTYGLAVKNLSVFELGIDKAEAFCQINGTLAEARTEISLNTTLVLKIMIPSNFGIGTKRIASVCEPIVSER